MLIWFEFRFLKNKWRQLNSNFFTIVESTTSKNCIGSFSVFKSIFLWRVLGYPNVCSSPFLTWLTKERWHWLGTKSITIAHQKNIVFGKKPKFWSTLLYQLGKTTDGELSISLIKSQIDYSGFNGRPKLRSIICLKFFFGVLVHFVHLLYISWDRIIAIVLNMLL